MKAAPASTSARTWVNVPATITGLISTQVDLGPARDSLTVSDPAIALKGAMAAMKKKGATVIVVLSQLGRTESEDLAELDNLA